MSTSPLATADLLAQLETISTEIPTIITYLAQSLNTLRDIDPARREVWIRNLAGLGGQYYGRIDRIQVTLRRVVRALRERESSPYAIRPPLPNTPLPKSFTPAQSPATINPENPEDQSTNPPSTADVATGVRDQGLSTYAMRLEVQALRDLHDALREMQREVKGSERGMEVA